MSDSSSVGIFLGLILLLFGFVITLATCASGPEAAEPEEQTRLHRLTSVCRSGYCVDIWRDARTGCEFVHTSSGGVAILPGTCAAAGPEALP
jgi:hypothetical protein